PRAKGEKDSDKFDDSREAAQKIFARVLAEKAELVLASDPELYETFRGLRDHGLAREIPFGFTGRRSVSIDMPRGSLDPGTLSDPPKLPHRRYLVISDEKRLETPPIANMEGIKATLKDVLKSSPMQSFGGAKKDEDMGFLNRVASKVAV